MATRCVAVEHIFSSISPTDCFHAFTSEVWRCGGGLSIPTMLKDGAPISCTGAIRRACFGYIEQVVLESVPGSYFAYRHISSAPLPVRSLLGRVTFSATGQDCRVVWTCRYTPLLCAGPLVSLMIWLVVGTMLRHLDTVLQSDNRISRGSNGPSNSTCGISEGSSDFTQWFSGIAGC